MRVSPEWAFAGLLLLGAVIVFLQTSGMSFYADEWDFVVARPGLSAHTLLTPHGPHLSLFPILIFKLLLRIFGGGSYIPFRLLAAFDIAIIGLAVGIACRDRWGRWWGLAPVLLFVTLGPAAQSLLWPFQVGYSLAVAFGLFSLIALDRGGRWADATACACLIVSLGSGSQGIGFVVGAALLVVLGGNWLRRAWVILLPALLYLVWYATYGHQHGETQLSLWSTSLVYAVQSLSASSQAMVGLSGLSSQTGTLDLTLGVPIAMAVLAGVAAAAWRGWRPRPIFWGAAVTLVVIWFAASLSNFGAFARPAASTRYLVTNAAILFVCLCAAVPKPRLLRGGTAIALIVLAVVSATNADQFGPQRTIFVAGAQIEQAELGALDLMRGIVSPSYSPGVVDPSLANIQAASFFSAQDSFGLRTDSVAQILAQPESTRQNVDGILAPNELALTPTADAGPSGATRVTAFGHPHRRGRCLIVGAGPLRIAVNSGSIAITAPPQLAATVLARRFSVEPVYSVGSIQAGSSAQLRITADRAPEQPWRLSVAGAGTRVCPSQ